VVGVNAFKVEEKLRLERLEVNPQLEAAQGERLAKLRATRDNGRVIELLNQLEGAARGAENLMPIFIECLENNVTLGEICGRLRTLWGEYQPTVT